jgi:phosphoribosylamine--glycine ligase
VAKVLVVGRGGREHALAWKLAQSPQVEQVYVAPGNGGTSQDALNVPIATDDFPALVQFAKEQQVDLVVVGPEEPLVRGIVDVFEAAGLPIFGPLRAAALLEGSKVFAKDLMRQAQIPTATYATFDDPDEAERYVQRLELEEVVVKADGLAGGKGSIVCSSKREALEAIRRMMRQREFGEAGRKIVIEEKLTGEELSVMAICDGRSLVRLEPAQDHKRAYDGDRGPNTGGMGAYTPAPMATPELLEQIDAQILVPTIHAMRRRGTPFRGVLYAGLMLTKAGPKVLEFNVRFGDPETQPLMMRLRTDLYQLLCAAVHGHLDELPGVEWDPRPSVCVVLAADGYPGPYTKGKPIYGVEEADALPDVKVFHAGTAWKDHQLVVDGGRVLGVTALGENLPEAKRRAYEAIRLIKTEGGWCRHDIGDRALQWLTRSLEPLP